MPYVGGMYSGTKYLAGAATLAGAQAIDNKIQDLLSKNQGDRIASVFMAPYEFITNDSTPIEKKVIVNRDNDPSRYIARNNKLYTYPYNFLCVDTISNTHVYRWEWAENPNAFTFSLVGGMGANMEIVAYPEDYNGIVGKNPTESITMSGFPQCTMPINSYAQWLGNHSTASILSLLATAAGGIASVASGNLTGGILGAIGVTSQVDSIVKDTTRGSRSRGIQGASSDTAIRLKKIYFKHMGITKEYAKMIDDFFDRFGYATDRIKIPNINVRPHWTYTKTRDCAIRGNVPVDDLAKIKSIFNAGITFWQNGGEVGNYSLDNSPSAS